MADDTHSPPHTGYRSFSETGIAERFAAFLQQKGLSEVATDEIPHLLSAFLTEQVPEIAAVAFLRNDFHRPGLVSQAPDYQGKSTDGSALDYLRTHYAQDIAQGTMTTAALQQASPKLFSSVDYELRKPANKVHRGMVIGTLELRDQRREKWGTILGTPNKEEVTKYALLFKDRRTNKSNKGRE